MNKKEIKIGQVYISKISGELASVRITREWPFGGWIGINLATQRSVHIKSAARLRYPVTPQTADQLAELLSAKAHKAILARQTDTTLRDEEREDFWLLDDPAVMP